MVKGIEVVYASLISIIFVTGIIATLFLVCGIVPLIEVLIGVK